MYTFVSVFFLMTRRPPRSTRTYTLFPYTTLFRSPPREDRPAFLNDEERAAVISGAANWLYVSQRVRIIDGPGPVDPQYGPYRSIGREGVVWRLCSSVFADHCRVFLDPVGAERAEKIVFIEIRDIAPLDRKRGV